MQDIDQEQLRLVFGGMASPNQQVGPVGGGAQSGGGRGAGGGGGGSGTYSLGGQVSSPGAFTAHYPGGGGRP
jgi:hypothetical protein